MIMFEVSSCLVLMMVSRGCNDVGEKGLINKG